MRGNPEAHQLVASTDLSHALAQISQAPGEWTPIAGGTELMVAHAAGRLSASKLISIWGLPELNFIRTSEGWVSIGGGVTFGQLRQSEVIVTEFPLLARAATWIGSIANQSRATIAGNIVNGSPAADAPPALLVYDAEIEMASEGATRRIGYADFHKGYKRNALLDNELVTAIHLPRRFQNHLQYLRKVGARKSMAITKVAIAATAAIGGDERLTEIRIAAASLADRPLRFSATEAVLLGEKLNRRTKLAARNALIEEAKPIDDIRSTADYRRVVAANLFDEFMLQLEQSWAGVDAQ